MKESQKQEDNRNLNEHEDIKEMDYRSEVGKPVIVLICGSLVYYHCAHRNSSLVSLVSDVLIVLLCSLAILGLLFRQMNISVPVDPLEWQISQDTANSIVAWLANTVGAAESVLRVAATGTTRALGRLVSGLTVAYAAENSQSISTCLSRFLRRTNDLAEEDAAEQDTM
ncbi:Reticulon family protein [Prunus dulcis]|uniref:Reticulon family protein n=1 Tax=Prunus dulcis TaxID=3755 RepID=A0A4Y1R3S8_PRUDU|nr:Reticulon family protein [Prunus dulcis]